MSLKLSAAASLVLVLTGCFGGSGPKPSATPGSARSQCDSFAAQAIQASDLGTATSLAAQASQCYSELRGRR